MIVVTLAELKAHLNIVPDEEGDDELITAYGDAAESWIGYFIGMDLAELDVVPDALKQAVRMLAAHYFENREAVNVGQTPETLPMGVFDLLRPLRTWTF